MTVLESEAEKGGIRGDYLILLQTATLPVTLITSYVIATSNKHVEMVFPYISDMGTWPPESCIFGILMCVYSFAIYIRWSLLNRYSTSGLFQSVNTLSFVVGLMEPLGLFIVANFQETNAAVIHFLGAILAFSAGCVYMWLQTMLSWKSPEVPGFSRAVLPLRLAITILATLTAILILPFSRAAEMRNQGLEAEPMKPGSGKWDGSLGGNDYHIASTSLEWVLATLAVLYPLTFIREFRHIRFGMPWVRVTDNDAINNGVLSNYGSSGIY